MPNKIRLQKLSLLMFEYSMISLISLLVATGFFLSSFYIHEGGHIIFGYLYNIWNGNYRIPYISNWIDFHGIPLPQQTNNENGVKSGWFTLGGIYMGLITTFIISWILSKKLPRVPKVLIYSIFLIFVIREIVGNFILGTDNYLGGPIIEMPVVKGSLEYLPFLLMFIFFFILMYYRDKFEKILNMYFKFIQRKS